MVRPFSSCQIACAAWPDGLRQPGLDTGDRPARRFEPASWESSLVRSGSRPFIFVKEEWRPGSQAVYVRNPDYVAGRLSE
jgi:hypothetical protein